jgi:SET domain-containing protein
MIIVKESSIEGTGIFAARDIKQGELIGEYTGDIITQDEADKRYEHEEKTYLFDIGDNQCIDAMYVNNPLKYVNHSCDPNCDDRQEGKRIFYYAKRNIVEGEELTVDYQLIVDEDEKDAFGCNCKSRDCRGTMRA